MSRLNNLSQIEKDMLVSVWEKVDKAHDTMKQYSNTEYRLRNALNAIKSQEVFDIKKDERLIKYMEDANVPLEVYTNKRVCPNKRIVSSSFDCSKMEAERVEAHNKCEEAYEIWERMDNSAKKMYESYNISVWDVTDYVKKMDKTS